MSGWLWSDALCGRTCAGIDMFLAADGPRRRRSVLVFVLMLGTLSIGVGITEVNRRI